MSWVNCKLWFRALAIKWLNIPFEIKTVEINLKPQQVDYIGPEHFEAWATLFARAPGLHDMWEQALYQVIDEMSKAPLNDEGHLMRIRLCQRAADLLQNLRIQEKAAHDLKRLHAVENKKQVEGNPASRNIM